MCTDADRRALTRARDELEHCLGEARNLVATAAFAVTHAGSDQALAEAIGSTLALAIEAMNRVEMAARAIAQVSVHVAAETPIPDAVTRH